MSRLFTGVESVVTPSASIYDNLGRATYTFWGKATAFVGNNVTFTKLGSLGNNTPLLFMHSGLGSKMDLYVGNGISTAFEWAVETNTTTFVIGTWGHLAIVVDWADFVQTKFYFNGVLIGLSVNSSNAGGHFSDAGGGFGIGGSPTFSGNSWHGLLSDFRIYNRVLTPAEIAIDITGAVPAAANLVGRWKMCANEAGAPDSSGNGNHGSLSTVIPVTSIDDPPSAPCPTIYLTELYHDDFNRANENPLDPKNWLERPATQSDPDVLQLLSGVCCSTIVGSNGGDGTAQYNPALPPDQYVECVLGSMDSTGFDFGSGLIGVLNLYIRDSSTQSFMVPFWTVGIANGIDGTGYMDYWQGANFGSGPLLPFDAAIYLNAPVGSMGPNFIKDRWVPGDKLGIAIIGDYATGKVYILKNGVVINSVRQNASTFSIQTGKAGLQIFQWTANRPAALSITRWAVGAASLDPFRKDIGVDAYIRVTSVTAPIIETVDFEPKIGKVRYF